MFSNFKVPEEQRDLLRFFWFQGNNPSNPIVPFRCSSHIFGACSSPAVATFAMKFCAANLPSTMKSDKYYIDSSFYVDDGILSCSTPGEAIEILTGAISCLRQYNVRLHKIVSNCNDVTNAFPSSELASMPSTLPITQFCLHNALGITWDTYSDSFVIQVIQTCVFPEVSSQTGSKLQDRKFTSLPMTLRMQLGLLPICGPSTITEWSMLHSLLHHHASPLAALPQCPASSCVRAALEASRCASTLLKELHSKRSVIFMHSDSQIVLGYIANHHRRFSKYIERRASLILKRKLQENWLYVPTKLNPADLASRPQTPVDLMTSCWFPGPPWLRDPECIPSPSPSVTLS